MGAAWVTGTGVEGSAGGLSGSPEVGEGVTRSQYQWRDNRITLSDPRLSGTLDIIYDQDVYSGASGGLSQFLVGSGTYRIQDEAGAWEGPSIFLYRGSAAGATVSDTGLLVGSGACEGRGAGSTPRTAP